jgi:hypothetical protein
MGFHRWLASGVVVVLVGALTAGGVARADDDLYAKPKPKNAPAPLVGLTQTQRIEPASGLIDVAIAADGAGLLAYVAADAASHAEVHVFDIATGTDVRVVDVSAFTTAPSRLWFTGKGKDAPILVVGPPASAIDGTQSTVQKAWLLDPKAKKGPRAFGPGEAIVLAERKGKRFVAVRTSKVGKKGTVYTFTRFDLKKGKKIGKPKTLTLDGGFTFHHWTADGMIAVGTKEGDFDKKEDVRLPDSEAWFDGLDPAAKKPTVSAIKDPMAHARRWQTLATEGGRSLFARVADDLDGVELWRDDQPAKLALDQPWQQYEPKSLSFGVGDDGTVWIGLAVDPWNREAVGRKKADADYFDVFRVDGANAIRVGRVLAPKGRFAIGATAGQVWLLERNVGFDRGGKTLTFYSTAS